MPKKPRIPNSSDIEDESQQSGSDLEPFKEKKPAPKPEKSKKKEKSAKKSKKPKADASSGEEEEKPPVSKKRKLAKVVEREKPAKSEKASASNGSDVKMSEEGDQYIDLGKRKRVTVRSFKNSPLLDIREFYEDKTTGQEKPGKKGISLSREQVCFHRPIHDVCL